METWSYREHLHNLVQATEKAAGSKCGETPATVYDEVPVSAGTSSVAHLNATATWRGKNPRGKQK